MGASYLYESFEGPGTENPWNVVIGAGCAIDPDNADVPPPPGGGAEILKMIGNGNGIANFMYYTLPIEAGDFWTSFYFRLEALGPAGADTQVAAASDSAWAVSWNVNAARVGPNYSLVLSLFYNGLFNFNVDNVPILLDNWYKVDVKYDRTNTAWEWRVNDIVELAGPLPGVLTLGLKWLAFYTLGWVPGFTATAYYDRIWIDDSEYGYGAVPVTPPSGGRGGHSKFRRRIALGQYR